MSMRRTFLCLALLAASFVTLAAAEDVTTTVRVFHLRHVSVMDASAAIQPVLSDEGSLTLQPHKSRLTVQDRPDVVAKVAKIIQTLDRLPEMYRLHVELLEGTKMTQEPISHPQTKVDQRLKRMFNFDTYRRVGTADFEGQMGDEAMANLGSGYRITFVAESLVVENAPYGMPNAGARIQLHGMVLSRMVEDAESAEAHAVEVLRTKVVLSPKQEVIIGAGSSEASSSGLVLILKALPAGE
jgi:hypothetical protein